MSFPDREKRKVCWDSRDRYWACLDDENVKDSSERPRACAEFRRVFENSCPSQWVTHFDRKRDYNIFKEKMQKEGFEPIKESAQHEMADKKMEDLLRIISEISTETRNLSLEQIQEILVFTNKCKRYSCNNVKEWNSIIDILWSHLHNEFNRIDDQLLCGTCFFNALPLSDKEEFYMSKIAELIKIQIENRSQHNHSRLSQITSLMYGMFQSSFLNYVSEITSKPVLLETLKLTFKLLTLKAYEYSQFTFIAFKTIDSFKKVCGTVLEEIILCKENQIELLNLVNHNWENPITGVRDLNRGIFRTILSVISVNEFQSLLKEINGFNWNKAKYLMLSETLEHYRGDISSIMLEANWMDGLTNSLLKPGLVSAGADMYYGILKRINSTDEWCDIFLHRVVHLLIYSSSKAIENFNNYWCLITLKKFNSLLNILIKELENFDDTEQKLYSILFIMKQGNKLGILDKKLQSTEPFRETVQVINIGIDHCNPQIRMLAFEIVCVSHIKILPNKMEYNIVLHYLENNINTDCTILRLNMLNSLMAFLNHLHILFRNMKTSTDMQELLQFCKNIQYLILKSLNSNGNYQRKVTNIQIIKTIIDSWTVIPKKKKDQIKKSNVSLVDYLKHHQCWILNDPNFILKLINQLKDPSDDIRDNVYKLLLIHYSKELSNSQFMSNLVEDALLCIKSKYFFEISCGHTIFKLIVNLLLKEKQNESMFSTVEDVVNFAHKELIEEYNLKQDVLQTIDKGKQLHSFICILQIALEACKINSHTISINNSETNLLDVLEGIANQFTSEQHNSSSHDFSKINVMVEDIIARSGFNITDDEDKTKISGLHQIVLNCLWLNVKAACDLASVLIQYYKEDIYKCGKCLTIITNVLETSRHKGAIEAAGAALGQSIQYLTRLPVVSAAAKLPHTLLISKLDMLIAESSKMASITRRGAGLSIMVHRIVSSDMRKGKPLFHYFMKTILKTCKATKDIPSLQNKENIENEMDLPKAIFIHFLTRIVTDSSLASDMMFYSAELAELAFSNLASSHWQIRNAALQLYGALIPRLIGQKKASGDNEETIATVACDELRTHSPQLWKFILQHLKTVNESDKICSHSNQVPILNLLASCAKRYNFDYDAKLLMNSDEDLLRSLMKLLNSPIHTVRRLTARCIFNIFSIEHISDALFKADYASENFLHGALLILQSCIRFYSKAHGKCLTDLQKKFYILVNSKNCSYWSKEVYFSNFCNAEVINMKNIFIELDKNVSSPGINVWVNSCIKNCLMNMEWSEIPDALLLLLERRESEVYLNYILSKLSTADAVPETLLKQVFVALLTFKNKYQSSVTWKILYEVSLKIDCCDIKVKDCLNFSLIEPCYKLRYVYPFLARFLEYTDEKYQQMIAEVIYKLCNFETTDVDMRYIAALANNELAKKLTKLIDDIKILSIKSAIILLHDEDEDIRNVSVEFYKLHNKLEVPVHANICIAKIINKNYLQKLFNKNSKAIQVICEDLLQFLSKNIHTTDKYNPFANDSKNIYMEVNILQQSLENLMNHLE